MRVIILLLLSIICTACAKTSTQDDSYEDYGDDSINATETQLDEDDDNLDDDDEGDMLNVIPVIKTNPQDFIAKVGDNVRLPCDVVNGDNFVVAWKKDDNLLVQGSFVLDTTREIINYSNSTIMIPNVQESDIGNYMCYVISNTHSINITHHLGLQTKPQITLLEAKNNITQVHEGDDLELICSASGYPKPEIKWYFNTKYNNSVGEQKESFFTGEKLLIEHIGLERSGYYRCLADNGKDNLPAHMSIFIEVTGKPSVRIEKIYTDNKLREIVCIVYAHPDANVHWKKDGKMLYKGGDNPNKILFNNIKKSDFGEYTCVAKNNFGEDKETVQITAVPEKPHLAMSKCTKHKDCVLGWTVHSHSPILESIIRYWEKGQSHAKEVFPPKPHNTKDNTFTMSYTFSELKRGSYEAELKSKNEYGWSQFSNITHFEIKGPRHTKHHSSHDDTKANNGVLDRAESHTEMKDQEQNQKEEEVNTGSRTSSGVTTVFTSELLAFIAISLLRP